MKSRRIIHFCWLFELKNKKLVRKLKSREAKLIDQIVTELWLKLKTDDSQVPSVSPFHCTIFSHLGEIRRENMFIYFSFLVGNIFSGSCYKCLWSMLYNRNISNVYNFKFYSNHFLKRWKETGENNFIFYFIQIFQNITSTCNQYIHY